jgi:5-methylcytosine-specific restriction endonuclease McrA
MSRLKHKRGRKSNYVKSLDNDYHREVKRKALVRDGFQCKICSSTIFLELHHISYYINNINIIGKELQYMEWVVILCEKCHPEVHANLRHRWNPKNWDKEPIN